MSSTPCKTQTYDPQIRNLLLYSTELKEHCGPDGSRTHVQYCVHIHLLSDRLGLPEFVSRPNWYQMPYCCPLKLNSGFRDVLVCILHQEVSITLQLALTFVLLDFLGRHCHCIGRAEGKCTNLVRHLLDEILGSYFSLHCTGCNNQPTNKYLLQYCQKPKYRPIIFKELKLIGEMTVGLAVSQSSWRQSLTQPLFPTLSMNF